MKRKIKVAHIVGKCIGGGVESVVMNYFRNIDHDSIHFTFICDEDSTNIPYDEIKKYGGDVIIVPPYQKLFRYIFSLTKILKEGNFDIAHSHINTLSVFSLFSAMCAGIPIRIAHSHSTTNQKEKKRNFMKKLLKPFSKVFATNYMCCSEFAGRWQFGNKEYDKGNVYLLNNAIDLSRFEYNESIRKKMRSEFNIDDDTIVLGHIGRFVTCKNHSFIIDIFNSLHKKNSKSVLFLVGQGPLVDQIKKIVDDYNLNDFVYFLGQRGDVNDLYQMFDVFLLPSLYEGLPVVGVEAQSSGLLCYLSNEMTMETKLLDSTVFMSLSDGPDIWANDILNKLDKYKRCSTFDIVSSKGFNIKNESCKLKEYYINLIK